MSIELKTSLNPESRVLTVDLSHSSPTASQQAAFKKELLRDTAILCEV
jgi:hypothetical protein